MKIVKKQFFKTGGIECFHAIQSFAKGEVTPEQAHEIGIKLAEELWGKKFQVVVSTHLNTNHVHSHFVLNSVSFIDGKRFCNTKKDYAQMRKTSDKLCEEYGLSVLKQEEKYNKYASSTLYKELMKDSIDYAIENAQNYNQFIKILEDLDYIVTDKNNTLSIRREPYKRNTRIERQFGKKYSIDNISKRILETQPQIPYLQNPQLILNRTYQNYNNLRKKYYNKKESIISLILYYENLFGINTEIESKLNIVKMTPELLKEIKQMDEYSNQAKLLDNYDIHTTEELIQLKKSIYGKINPLKNQRENLWRKHKRAKTQDEKTTIEDEIADISKQITPLAEEIKCFEKIQGRLDAIKKYKLHQQLVDENTINKQQEKDKIKIR